MIFLVATGILLQLAGLGSASEGIFSYDAQSDWTGICENGNAVQQSPVDIITTDAREDTNLTDLQMAGWDVSVNGEFSNTNNSVMFDLDKDGESVMTTNHIGTYNLLQFHMHWGAGDGQGSEHRVDGEQAELEIHFVHSLPDAPGSERNNLTVVGVFGDVDEDAPLTTPWTLLDPTAIKDSGSDSVTITGIRMDQFLPDGDLEYWHYEGSLTTPPCSEVVAWFVLRNRITVPGAFLEKLREVETSPGDPLLFNFRMAQDIGERSVSIQSSGASPSSQAIPLLSLFMMISALQLIGL